MVGTRFGCVDRTPTDVLDALNALEATLDALVQPRERSDSATGWWQLTDADLPECLRRLASLSHRLDVAQADVVAEAVGRGLPGTAGARTAAGWVGQLLPVTPREAAAVADHAALVADPLLRPVNHVVRSGEVSRTRALVAAQAIRKLPTAVDAETRSDATEFLADQARHFDATALGRLGRHLTLRLDPEGGEKLAKDEEATHRARTFAILEDHDGSWHLRGRLGQVAGQAVAAAIGVLAKPLPASDGTPDPRTTGQRNADALEQLAQRAMSLEEGEAGALPERGAVPPRVVLNVDLATVLARLGSPHVRYAASDTDTPVSPFQLSLLLCDAEIEPHLRSWDGQQLDVGRSVYSFPRRIRRAIAARDRHCTYRRCTTPASWCHVHHLVAFSRGGATSERNGALLCGRHHRHVHASGLVGRLAGDQVRWEPAPGARRTTTGPAGRDDPVAHAPARSAIHAAVDDLVRRFALRQPVAG